MPAERLSMRKVREVLRLKYACGTSERVIARSAQTVGHITPAVPPIKNLISASRHCSGRARIRGVG
jgi:hypothetical protein